MIVRYDDQIFISQVRGGVSRYFVELMRNLSTMTSSRISVSGPTWTLNQHLLEAGMAKAPLPSLRHASLLRPLNRLAEGRDASPDIIHHTYYDQRYLMRYPRAPKVVTVYDMIPELFPALFPKGGPHLHKRAFVAAADLIICISESTRSDMVAVYGTPSAPVEVIPMGVDFSHFSQADEYRHLPGPYILYVGSRGGYKDFTVAAKALAHLVKEGYGLEMVCAGGGALTDEENQLLASLGVLEHVRQIVLRDRELPGVYQGAECFVFPSRYEGFGLPTLEAMAAGCPTILARSSSHPEAGGGAALYFDPGNAIGLAGCIAKILTDPQSARRMAEVGRDRARIFSWSSTADQTAKAYRSVLHCGPPPDGGHLP